VWGENKEVGEGGRGGRSDQRSLLCCWPGRKKKMKSPNEGSGETLSAGEIQSRKPGEKQEKTRG